MTKPGMSRTTSAGRPCGRSSKSVPGMKTSDDDETGGGAVTTTGGSTDSPGVVSSAAEGDEPIVTRTMSSAKNQVSGVVYSRLVRFVVTLLVMVTAVTLASAADRDERSPRDG